MNFKKMTDDEVVQFVTEQGAQGMNRFITGLLLTGKNSDIKAVVGRLDKLKDRIEEIGIVMFTGK